MKKDTVKKTTSTKKKAIEEKTTEVVEEEIELTPAEITAEKLKEIDGDVFKTTVAGVQVVWRKLKRSEYKEAMSIKFDENEDINYFERQDFMAKKVILYPENVDSLLEDYAGISDIIATETMVKTGFGIANTKAVK